jgi:hypothetical protein
VFGHYVGHDEPSVLFYSNTPGSGNHMQYNVTLPTEPSGTFSDTKGYSLETSPAFWFGTARIGGSPEYVNFAYLTVSGKPIGPPNPLHFQFIGSGDPHSSPDTFYMNQGDNVTVSLSDTPNGLHAVVHDNTNPDPATNTGIMTASAANGFGQIKFLASGHACQEIPYTFHPMYSTSTPQTRVLWAAHTYNVAMDAERGHFGFCSSIDPNTDTCNGTEGIPGDQEAADGEDAVCFSDVQNTNHNYVAPPGQDAAYCAFENLGFDGTSYNNYWPNSAPTNATAFLFSSPRTGTTDTTPYPQAAFEADLPGIESNTIGGPCDNVTGTGCTNPPVTDDGAPVNFYPYFSTVDNGGTCNWGAGATLPHTLNDFGGNSTAEFGSLLAAPYWVTGAHGKAQNLFENYGSGPIPNPC